MCVMCETMKGSNNKKAFYVLTKYKFNLLITYKSIESFYFITWQKCTIYSKIKKE